MAEQSVRFTVMGVPVPQGSKRLVGVNAGRARMIDDNQKLKPWRRLVAETALAARGPGWRMLSGPVEVEIRFVFPRPKSPKCSSAPCVKPDCDKLARAVFDSLTGVIYEDDAQVTDLISRKRYGPPELGRGSGMAIVMVRPANVTWP